MYFCRKGCSMLFCTERVVHVSVDCYDPVRAWHLELELCIVWYRIESSECGSSEQCVVTTTETTSSVIEPVQRASTPGITPLKVVLVGLILEGSMLKAGSGCCRRP